MTPPTSTPATAPTSLPATRLAEALSDIAATTAPAGGDPSLLAQTYPLLGGVWLGWALGANDASNVFGTAVASRMVRFRTAVLLASVFVVAGAVIGGAGGMETLSGLATQSLHSAMIVTAAAAAVVTVMTALKLPVSTSQGVVGAILGVGLATDPAGVKWSMLVKVVLAWVSAPVGAMVVAMVLYPVLGRLLGVLRLSLVRRSQVLKAALIVSGSYGAYALGANNVANVVGVFYGSAPFGDDSRMWALLGAGAIVLGIVTFSRRVMFTVGRSLVQLDAFSALVAVLSQGTTVLVLAYVGVPVSTSTAIVGGVLGIGIVKGVRTINLRTLARILSGWVSTPLLAGLSAFALAWLLL
jgi:PiT family inorganic phosphate transporter